MTSVVLVALATVLIMSQWWRLGCAGIVHRVIDGDDVEVNVDGKIIRVRIANIDAPEWLAPYGRAARGALAQLIPVGTHVRVGWMRRDRYQRRVAKISVAGRAVGCIMARRGMAHGRTYAAARHAAFAAAHRLGLWNDPKPIHPAIWRRRAGTSRFDAARA